MRGDDRKWSVGAVLVAGFACVMWSAGAGADSVAQVTAATGEVDGVSEAGSLEEGDHVKLGEDSGCAILVDQDALVELCGQTSLVLRKDRDSNRRIVDLAAGEIKLVVEPRQFDERIEIHTPTAIATLLGTIVHISIDPVTGATTISSAESKVAVRNQDPEVRGTTVVKAGHQVTVEAGEAPPAVPKKLEPVQLAELGGCLVDFHGAALGGSRETHQERVAERLTALDVARNGEGGDFQTPPARPRIPKFPGNPIGGQEGVCEVTDCSGEVEQPEEPMMGRGYQQSF